MIKSVSFIFIVVLLVLTGCEKTEQKTAEQLAVDSLFSEWNQSGSPGAALSIIQNGEMLYTAEYGEANIEYGIPIENDTVFHVASVSKQFTAMAIALLADQGYLSLDDDIRDYIPEVPDFGEIITIRHLANHTSGLRDQWGTLGLAGWRIDDVITTEHVLKLVERQEALNFPVNDQYMYSNTGYTLLAEIVARVSGQSFGEWMETNVFTPLQMTHTQIYDDHERIVLNRADSYSDRLHNSYQDVEDVLKNSALNFATFGATSLFTTASDLALWLNNYSVMALGSAEVYQNMRTQGVLNDGEIIDYALGLFVAKYRGLSSLSHRGGDAGYRSYVVYFPDHQFGVSVLTNLASFDPGGLGLEIAEIYLAEFMEAEEEEETVEPVQSEIAAEIEVDLTLLEAYVGSYFSRELQTTYTFVVKDGRLVATHPRHSDINFTPIELDKFSGPIWFFGQARFERDDRGEINRLYASSGRSLNVEFNKVEADVSQ